MSDATPNTTTTTHIPMAMTVLGPVSATDLGIVLMNEPLIANPLFKTIKAGGNALSWDDLAAIRADPFSHADNMTLSSAPDAINEITKPTNTSSGQSHQTLLDTTAVDNGRDFRKAKTISEITGKHIVLGTTPSETSLISKQEESAVHAESQQSPPNLVEASKRDIDRMEQELIYGVEEEQDPTAGSGATTKAPLLLRAGFIGELHIVTLDEAELRQLQACAVVQHTTKAPFLLSVPAQHTNAALEHIRTCGGDLTRTVLTRMDFYYKNNLRELQQVLDKGVCICMDRFAVAPAIWDLDGNYPSIKETVEMIEALLQHNPNYIHQLFVSSGVFLKLQYVKYGGVGYNAVLGHLVPRLLQKGTITTTQIQTILQDNPKRLLCWWTPPPPKEIPKEYLPCSVCKKMFEPIVGEYYTKYSFTYCGTDCLRKHRKLGFKAIE